jgi:hypothetical protein
MLLQFVVLVLCYYFLLSQSAIPYPLARYHPFPDRIPDYDVEDFRGEFVMVEH